MKEWLTSQLEHSAWLQKAWAWYLECSVREQRLLCIAMVLSMAVLLYLVVLAPLEKEQRIAQQEYVQAQQQYQALQMHAQQLLASRPMQTFEDRSIDELRRVLSQTAAAAQFSADRVQVEGDSRLQVWASEVSFAVVAKWLKRLAAERVAIHHLQLERVGEGIVNLRLTLD